MGSVRLSPQLKEKVNKIALNKGITRSEVFRRALEAYSEKELAEPLTSRYDDIIGVVDAPGDFSTRTRFYFGEIMDEKYGKTSK